MATAVGPRAVDGLEPVINFPVGRVASANCARRGGGRRLWLFQGEDDNEAWHNLRRNPEGWGRFSRFLCRSSLEDTRYSLLLPSRTQKNRLPAQPARKLITGSRVAGHRAGVATARRIVERAPEIGIGRLTLYAFSSDNWRRPAPEVQSIFWLLRAFLRLQTRRMTERGVRLQVIGRRDRLSAEVLRSIQKAEAATADGRTLDLRVAIDYSSRESISRAAWSAAIASFDRPHSVDALNASLMSTLTAENGEVDLLIRTGGEKRLSDFLLWESAYAELYFTDCMWPDFNESGLDAAVSDFRRRERRFGAVPAPAVAAGGAR